MPRDGFEFDPHLTGQGERMNYSPFLSYSLISARLIPGSGKKDPDRWDGLWLPTDKQTIFLRPVNVYLGGRYAAAFDTETLGYAAAWSGGFLDVTRTNLIGTKGADLAYLRPPVVFQNTPAPGWSLDGCGPRTARRWKPRCTTRSTTCRSREEWKPRNTRNTRKGRQERRG